MVAALVVLLIAFLGVFSSSQSDSRKEAATRRGQPNLGRPEDRLPARSGSVTPLLSADLNANQQAPADWAAVAALCVSGLLRALETFASQAAWNDPDLIWITLLQLVNWVCNVFLPIYAAAEVVLGAVHYAGLGRIMPGSAWLRHFTAAALCLLASGIIRLAEFFVLRGTGGVS